MAFTTITIEGEVKGPHGEPVNGSVRAILSTTVTNGSTTVVPVTVTGRIQNGQLSMHLIANDDPDTLPKGSFYKFIVSSANIKPYEFTVRIKADTPEGKIDLSKLYEESGFIGAKVRPTMLASATTQEIVEALRTLELIEYAETQSGQSE